MRIPTTILLLLFSIFSIAQVKFESHMIIGEEKSNDWVKSCFSADIDGDEDNDLILVSNRTINWYENFDGSGNFSSKRIIDSEKYFKTAIAVDLDNDGDLDLVAGTNSDNAKLVWYENIDNKGKYSEAKVISNSHGNPIIIRSNDVDGDGLNDIILGNQVNYVWYKNISKGSTFEFMQSVKNSHGTQVLELKDMDNDGDLDIVCSKSSIIWYENVDGKGDFEFERYKITPLKRTDEFIFNDVDGDGDEDIVAIVNNRVGWLENIEGEFSNFKSSHWFNNSISDNKIFTDDIDGDGDSDIILTRADNLFIFKNDGKGDFKLFKTESIIRISHYNLILFNDIDNDRDKDLILVENENGFFAKMYLFDNENSELKFAYLGDIFKVRYSRLIDMDNDGDDDIFLLSKYFVGWYENNGGVFTNRHNVGMGMSSDKVVIEDIDKDGDLDVLSSGFAQKNIRYYENLGDLKRFKEPILLNYKDAEIEAISSGDIDGDGDTDLIVFYQTSFLTDDRSAWFENKKGIIDMDNPHVFSKSFSTYYKVFKCVDIDGDKDMDIVTGSTTSFGGGIYWFENINTKGEFSKSKIIQGQLDDNYIHSLFICDIDGDKDIDIVSSSFGLNTISWYENLDGHGNFSSRNLISNNQDRPIDIYAIDIDGDNDNDIVVASKNDEKVSLFENTGGIGKFGPSQIISEGISNLLNVSASDIDNDGDKDILITSEDGLYLLTNKGFSLNRIEGKLFFDRNGNGCDSLSIAVPNKLVSTSDGSISSKSFSLKNGSYQFYIDEGEFTTKVLPDNDYFTITPNDYITQLVGVNNRKDSLNFCLEAKKEVNDVGISILPLSDSRAGRNSKYRLVCQNIGTKRMNGRIEIEFDTTKMDFKNSSSFFEKLEGNVIKFNYPKLDPFEVLEIDLTFELFRPPMTNLNDSLKFIGKIFPVEGDANQLDNVFELEQNVVGSFDPNDIVVLEGDKLKIEDIDKYLHYIIRFQNTGNAEALRVRVQNVLDDNLNWNSLRIENSSHQVVVKIKDGNLIDFIFDSINLPDSTNNEEMSHGFVSYKILPKDDLVKGDFISNQADIYFDYNLPIETNTVITQVISSLYTTSFENLKYRIFPNPTSNLINIESISDVCCIDIFNSLGLLMKTELTKNTIDISDFNNGIYYVRIQDLNKKIVLIKVIKI